MKHKVGVHTSTHTKPNKSKHPLAMGHHHRIQKPSWQVRLKDFYRKLDARHGVEPPPEEAAAAAAAAQAEEERRRRVLLVVVLCTCVCVCV